MDKVAKSTDQFIEKVDGVLSAKEKEILESLNKVNPVRKSSAFYGKAHAGH